MIDYLLAFLMRHDVIFLHQFMLTFKIYLSNGPGHMSLHTSLMVLTMTGVSVPANHAQSPRVRSRTHPYLRVVIGGILHAFRVRIRVPIEVGHQTLCYDQLIDNW